MSTSTAKELAAENETLRRDVQHLHDRIESLHLLGERRCSTLTCYMENLLLSAGMCRIITGPDFGVLRSRNTLPLFGRIPSHVHIAELFGTDAARRYFQRIRQLRVDMLSLAEQAAAQPWKLAFDSSSDPSGLATWLQHPAHSWSVQGDKAVADAQLIQAGYYLSSSREIVRPDEDFRVEYTGVSAEPATELTLTVGGAPDEDDTGALIRHPEGDGYTFAFGASRNMATEIHRRMIPLITTDRVLVQPGVSHHCMAERVGGQLRLVVDDLPPVVVVDPLPVLGKGCGHVSLFASGAGQVFSNIRVYTRPSCISAALRDEVEELCNAVLEMRRDNEVRYLRVHYQSPMRYHFSDVSYVMKERMLAAARERSLFEATARADKMESLAAMAAGVAHDLNNIMGPIIGFPSMIQEQLNGIAPANCIQTAQDVRQDLEAIDWAANRAAMVVRDLLTLSRRGQYARKALDINQVISAYVQSREILMLKGDHPSVTIRMDLAPALPAVNASEPHLLRVIGNLIRNACEAVAGQGEVCIATTLVQSEEARIGMEVVPPGSYVAVRVNDTGAGIEPKHLPRLFEPFFSTKAKTRHSGTGLGLAVVHGIIKDHAGFLDVKSVQGKGSVFEFLLPRIQEEPAPKVAEDVRVRTGTGHILVVDDAEAQRIMAKRMLARLGYTATAVENGHEGVKLFKEALDKGIAKAFDLVMLDMVMEDGYDGLDTAEDILKLYPTQRIIIVSGFAHNDRVRHAVSRGAGWLAKPYTLTELAETVAAKISDKSNPA